MTGLCLLELLHLSPPCVYLELEHLSQTDICLPQMRTVTCFITTLTNYFCFLWHTEASFRVCVVGRRWVHGPSVVCGQGDAFRGGQVFQGTCMVLGWNLQSLCLNADDYVWFPSTQPAETFLLCYSALEAVPEQEPCNCCPTMSFQFLYGFFWFIVEPFPNWRNKNKITKRCFLLFDSSHIHSSLLCFMSASGHLHSWQLT